MVLVKPGGGAGMAQARQQRRGKRAGRRAGARRQQLQATFGVPDVDTLDPWQQIMQGSRGQAAVESTRATYT